MQNLHIIEIRFLPPTINKGDRVSLKSNRFNESKVISYTYSHNDIKGDAIDYLESKGFNIIGYGQSSTGYSIITDTFNGIK